MDCKVSSFFYYMWNRFNREECMKAFAEAPCGPEYIWEKYSEFHKQYGAHGAISVFYSYLAAHNTALLEARAAQLYDGDRYIG